MAEDLGDGEVDEVPVVGALGVLEIENEDFVATADSGFIVFEALGGELLKFRHEDEQTAETDFVPAAHKQFGDFAQGEVFCHALDDFARLGHFESEELVALAIFTGAGLEETHEYLSLRLILLRLHIVNDFSGCRILGHWTLKIED